MNSAITQFIGILTLLITVAIVAVIVSKKANTSQVIQAFGSAMSNMLAVVVSPVSGS